MYYRQNECGAGENGVVVSCRQTRGIFSRNVQCENNDHLWSMHTSDHHRFAKISDFTGSTSQFIPAPHPHPSYTTGYIRGTRRELVEHKPQPSALLCIETYEICTSRSGCILVYNAATSCATHVPFFALPFLQVIRAALWQV